MPYKSITLQNIIGIHLELPATARENWFKRLFSVFELFNFSEYFIKYNPGSFDSFTKFIAGYSTPLKLFYSHTPILNNIILKDLHETSQIFQPQLFCRKNYFKQHKSWGYPIFHFTDEQPEIYEYPDNTTQINTILAKPEDIAALILLKPAKSKYLAQNIIQKLNRKNGQLNIKLNKGEPYKLVVIRKLYLHFDNGLKYKINIHDDYLLKTQAEIAGKQVDASKFNGAYLEADDFFALKGFITSGPEITRNYHRISENKFKPDLALFWSTYGNEADIQNIIVSRMLNTYIDGNLLPKLNYIHRNTKLKASITNPFFVTNLAALKTTYIIDEDRFFFQEDYYLSAIINLKRILSYKTAHNDLQMAIEFGDLLNIKHSFIEKKASLDILLGMGISKIFFRFDGEMDTANLITQKVFEDNSLLGQYGNWINYLNRLSQYMHGGKAVSKILLLYPSLDYDRVNFVDTVKQMEKSCFEYDIMDLQVFISNDDFTVSPEMITLLGSRYHTIILAGINKIPLKAIKRINEFVAAGGVAICLNNLPAEIEKQEDISKLKDLLSAIWLDNSDSTSTSYKTNINGGVGYFQKETALLHHVLSEQNIRFRYPVYTENEKIKIFIRDLGESYTAFIINTASKPQKNVLITCRTKSNMLFKISSEDGLLYPFGPANVTDEVAEIFINFERYESVLLKIYKEKSNEDIAADGPVATTSIMEIDSGGWFLNFGKTEEIVTLGDRSISKPYEWQSLTYSKIIKLDKSQLNGSKVYLNIDELYDWCTLLINDKKVGSRLFPPWEFEISSFLVPGNNGITLEVGHRLSNYMAITIGSQKNMAPVVPYGLIGPVRVLIEHSAAL